MRLIGLAVFLTVGLILAPLAAEAQLAEKVYRIGLFHVGKKRDPVQRATRRVSPMELQVEIGSST